MRSVGALSGLAAAVAVAATALPVGAAPRVLLPRPFAARWRARPSEPITQDLPNGLRLLCIENPAAHTVALSAFVKTTARAEAPALAGIRNFVARALVDCSVRERDGLSERLQDLGAELYATAAIDFTEISLLAAAEDFEPAARVLHDILLHPRFANQCVARLRSELALAAAQSDELPDIAAERAAAARLFPGHPLGWPVGGLATSIPAFTVEDVRRVHAGSYLTNNLLIAVAGGVSADLSAEVLQSVFSDSLPGRRLPESREAPPPVRAGRLELVRPGKSASVHIGARAPGPSDPEYAAAAVALAVLGSGMGSRLYDALRRDRPLTYTVATAAVTAMEGSRASIRAACAPESAAEVEAIILREVRRLTRETATPKEIQRATEYICTSYALNHQRNAELAHQLGAFELTAEEGYRLDWELPRRVRRVTAGDVRDVARALFGEIVVVRVLPT